jgi:DDE domain
LLQRRQRLERQDPRVLDAYQAEIITLSALQPRRQKLAAALQQIEQESRQWAHTRQQSIHWQQVIDHAATFRQLLGDHLEQLSCVERQAITRCLISKVVVTGEEVDVQFVRPFDATPQMARHLPHETEGTPGHFYRLRLAHFEVPLVARLGTPARSWLAYGWPMTGPTELDLRVPDQAKFVICNHTIEQDHRAVKRITRPMLEFKSFATPHATLAGIELMHMLKKRQLMIEEGGEGLTAAEQFYALAA